jgi:hypothetical protein
MMAIGIPGGIGDLLKLASQRLEGRILELLEKPFAELGLVEGRIGRALPRFWNGQGELLLQECGVPSLQRRVAMPVPAWRLPEAITICLFQLGPSYLPHCQWSSLCRPYPLSA